MNWQPIETHDGSAGEVIGASVTERWVSSVERYGECWRATNNPPTDHWGRDLYPTHWMPLPDLPGDASEVNARE